MHTARSAPTTAARRPSHGAGCTGLTSGYMSSGRSSSFGSRSAGSAPSGASAPGQPTWITSWTTRATGMCSVIWQTWRAFATPATVGKRRGNCGKIERKRSGAERQNGAGFGRRRAMHSASRGDPCRPSHPVKKVLAGPLKTVWQPPCKKFSPPGNSVTVAAGPQQVCGVCCGSAAGTVLALKERSGYWGGAEGTQRGICGFLPGGLPLPDSSPFRVPADQPVGLPAESRSNVPSLNTDRLEAPKACAPAWGIDVGTLGDWFRDCSGLASPHTHYFTATGCRRVNAGTRKSPGMINTAAFCRMAYLFPPVLGNR